MPDAGNPAPAKYADFSYGSKKCCSGETEARYQELFLIRAILCKIVNGIVLLMIRREKMKTSCKFIFLAFVFMMVLSLSAFQEAEDTLLIRRDSAADREPLISSDPGNDEETSELNPVTGLPVSNPSLLTLPPVFVPLARYPSAFRPSSGHSQAQWVFEMYVNDEESRPVLMFYGELPSVPVSRISSGFFGLEHLRKQYGGIIIMGGTSSSVLNSDILSYELWYGTTFDQLYPELPVADYQRILNKWVPLSTPADPNNLKYEFDVNPPEGGRNASSLFLRYAETNKILWEYSETFGKYMRGQNSVEDPKTIAADVDTGTGEQIGVENLIILMAHHDWVPGYPMSYGLFDVDINYVEESPGLIFRDGKLYNVTWTTQSDTFERESYRMRPIRFLDADGNAFRLKPGKTWVHVVMTGNPYYEVDDPLGSQVTAGTGYWKMPYISFKSADWDKIPEGVEELKDFNYKLNGAQ